jgi:putative redox protein
MNSILPRRLFARDITGTVTAARPAVDVEWRAGTLVIDEPKFNGGHDLGPDPFTMIVAGLVGCTLTTLRMYIHRKGWLVEDITVYANLVQTEDPFRTVILRTIVFGQPVSDEQAEKLLQIAKNCPAARLLEGRIEIDTVIDEADSGDHQGRGVRDVRGAV